MVAEGLGVVLADSGLLLVLVAPGSRVEVLMVEQWPGLEKCCC